MSEKEETKRCPSCDKEISIKAKRCPYCRQDLRSFPGRHPILTVIGVIFIFGWLISISPEQKKDGDKVTPTPSPKTTEFNAAVNFTGTQFVISNLDKFDCINAKMEINGGLLKGGYVLEGTTLETGKEYTVGAAQFAKNDGTRFDPFSVKPQNFNINCRGNNELSSAFWYGEFK